MTITAKPQNQKNKKNKTLKRLFGLASKDVFFVILVFFCFEMQKPKKNLCFLVFGDFLQP